VRLVAVSLVVAGVYGLLLAPARADDDGPPKPAPRTAIVIGGATVVLVSADNKLYAFVDRVEDNAPVTDAELSIDTSEGASITMNKVPITMNKATAGMFIGELNRKGHAQDAFMVSLQSAAGTGDAPAEIAYNDVPDAVTAPAPPGIGEKIAMVLVSGSIGTLGAVLFVLWRGGRRRTSVGAVRTV
jgi:hypothetical protein